MYKQGSGYGFPLMGNRLKEQEATKTYEVCSGSLFSKYERSLQEIQGITVFLQ